MNPRPFVAAALTCCLTSCGRPADPVPPPSIATGSVGVPLKGRAAGTLAFSNDDAFLYAVDTDLGVLGVFDLTAEKTVATVKVGEAPSRVVVGPDDTVYVANRRSRSISVVRRGEWTVALELATDVDPVGLGVGADNTVYVVCATAASAAEYGTLTAFNPQTGSKVWAVSVGTEPAGLALVGGDRAVVSLRNEGEAVLVDLQAHAIVPTDHGAVYSRLNASASGTTGSPRFHPRGLAVLVEGTGGRVYGLGSLSRETAIVLPPSTTRPYYQAQGPGNVGAVSVGAVFTFDTQGKGLQPRVDDLNRVGGDHDVTQTGFATGGGAPVLQGLTAGVTDPSGEWLYVVARETNTLARISARTRNAHTYSYVGADLPSVFGTAEVGAGADGVAVRVWSNADAPREVYVYNQFDHRLQVFFDGTPRPPRTLATLGNDTLGPTEALGRRLFFSANDRRLSSAASAVSCNGCHGEGRDDGHVWSFPDGPRQTPVLAGRGILETAPFHWSGEFPQMNDFMSHTLRARMGGTGLDATASAALNAYVAQLKAPENPHQGQQTEAVERGRLAFTKAQCQTCHSGTWFTHNGNAKVGTLTPTDTGPVEKDGFNVPSLRGLARSAPYLHDGSVMSLSERVLKNPGDQHGVTSTLTEQEKADLVAYLRTL